MSNGRARRSLGHKAAPTAQIGQARAELSDREAFRQSFEPLPLPAIASVRESQQEGEGSTALVPFAEIRLRIAGLGHHFELDAAPTATLGDLKEEIARRIELPAPYQRLVAKRKKLDDDTMVLGPTVMDGNNIVSMGIGLEHGTKILMLHSQNYEKDRDGIDRLTELAKEIDNVDHGRRNRDMDNKLVQELVIQICCKIDCVETNGSEPLRKMRKLTIKKAEEVAKKSEEDVRGLEP